MTIGIFWCRQMKAPATQRRAEPQTTTQKPQTGNMKCPTEAGSKESKPLHEDHLVGDCLRVKKSSNKSNLWVQGDGCRVSLSTNSGLLRITGDGCSVRITRNLGSIEYTGDGGHIVLGPESLAGERIKYKGDGGLIEFEDVQKKKQKKTKSTEGSDNQFVTVTKVTTTKRDEERNKTRAKNGLVNVGVNVTVCMKNKV